MIRFTPDGFQLGTYVLSWFGLAVVLGVWAGVEVAARLAKRAGIAPKHAWRAMLWVAPLAIIGGRLWFVLFPPESMVRLGRTAGWMLSNFIDLNQGAVAVWTGGMGLFGAVLGAVIGLAVYARRQGARGLGLWAWFDIGAVGLALAQTIGRFGEWREVYGPPTEGLSQAWGVLINNPAFRVAPYDDLARFPLDSTYFHPLWLYESMLAGAIFAVLLTLQIKNTRISHNTPETRQKPGDLALLYLILYGFGRFFLEFMRVNPSLVAGVNVSQVAALGVGVVALIIRVRRPDQRIPIP